jgi:CTP synthase (UTP-ammonia lyase)
MAEFAGRNDLTRVGIIGDYDPSYTGHRNTGEALEAAGKRTGVGLVYEWVATDMVDAAGTSVLEEFDGLWASPGSPYRSMEGALAGIRFAREHDRPFIGT